MQIATSNDRLNTADESAALSTFTIVNRVQPGGKFPTSLVNAARLSNRHYFRPVSETAKASARSMMTQNLLLWKQGQARLSARTAEESTGLFCQRTWMWRTQDRCNEKSKSMEGFVTKSEQRFWPDSDSGPTFIFIHAYRFLTRRDFRGWVRFSVRKPWGHSWCVGANCVTVFTSNRRTVLGGSKWRFPWRYRGTGRTISN